VVISYRRFGTAICKGQESKKNLLVFLYVSVPSSRAWNPKGIFLKTGPIGCPETSVRNFHHSLRKAQKSAVVFTNLRVETLQLQSGSSVQTGSTLLKRSGTNTRALKTYVRYAAVQYTYIIYSILHLQYAVRTSHCTYSILCIQYTALTVYCTYSIL